MNRVHYNKSMLFTAMLPMLFIAVCSLYLLLDGAEQVRESFLFGALDSAWLFYPCLAVVFVIFAEYSRQSLRKVIRKKPALRWGNGGLALANGSRVAWAAVERIDVCHHKKQQFVLLQLDQPMAFIDMQSGPRRAEAQHNFRRLRTPVAILCDELAISAQDLQQQLQSQHLQFLQQQCSKP